MHHHETPEGNEDDYQDWLAEQEREAAEPLGGCGVILLAGVGTFLLGCFVMWLRSH